MEGTQLARLPNELLCRINDIVMQSTYTRSYTLPDGTIRTIVPTSSCRLAPARDCASRWAYQSPLPLHSPPLHTDQVITLDTERFRCVEPVFAPCMIGIDRQVVGPDHCAATTLTTDQSCFCLLSFLVVILGYSAADLTDNLYTTIYRCGPDVRYASAPVGLWWCERPVLDAFFHAATTAS